MPNAQVEVTYFAEDEDFGVTRYQKLYANGSTVHNAITVTANPSTYKFLIPNRVFNRTGRINLKFRNVGHSGTASGEVSERAAVVSEIYLGYPPIEKQAESGILNEQFIIETDEESSNNQRISSDDAFGDIPATADYSVELSPGLDYTLWARVKTHPSNLPLPLEVSFNESIVANLIILQPGWRWVQLTENDIPILFSGDSSGTSTIGFRATIPDVQIDNFILTNNINFIPRGRNGYANEDSASFAKKLIPPKQESVAFGFPLLQNHPNPFNPTTTIEYDLPEQVDVVLTIYDILGREVRKWQWQKQEAGYYSVTWDGTNFSGKEVSSGVYFVVLLVPNNHQIIQKLMLIR